jgi:hypothetical protein
LQTRKTTVKGKSIVLPVVHIATLRREMPLVVSLDLFPRWVLFCIGVADQQLYQDQLSFSLTVEYQI